MTTIFKSVHIKECWPYEYGKVSEWQLRSQEAKDRRNAQKREQRRLKAASVKTLDGKKLLKLPVYSMSIDFCNGLNERSGL